MFIDKDSLIIDGVSMGKYLTSVKYNYNKLWGEDSGRTLNGNMVATLVGIVVKLECNFRELTKAETELLAPIFDRAEQTIVYYDPIKKANNTIKTYSNDWGISFLNINRGETFSVSFIGRGVR